MPTIPTVLTGTNIQSVGIQNSFRAAISERARATDGDASFPILPAIAQGDYIGSWAYWRTLQDATYYLADGGAGGFGVDWADPTAIVEGATVVGVFAAPPGTGNSILWGYSQMRVAAGLPTTLYYTWDGTTLTHNAALDNTLWRDFRPREILSTASVFDVQGNPAVAGQRAYLVGDGGTPTWPPFGSGFPNNTVFGSLGTLYVFNGATWDRDPGGHTPDVLDNTLAPPNCISDATRPESTTFGTLKTGLGGGSYINYAPQLLAEIRAVLLQMKRQAIGGLSSAGGIPGDVYHRNGPTIGGASVTYAGAVANFAGVWGAKAIDGAAGGLYAYGDVSANGTGTNWAEFGDRRDTTWDSSGVPFGPAGGFTSVVNKTYSWYVYDDTPTAGGNIPGATVFIFDAQGDGGLQGQYHAIATAGPDTLAVITQASGNANTLPTPPLVTAVPLGGSALAGYMMEDAAVVIDWAFTWT